MAAEKDSGYVVTGALIQVYDGPRVVYLHYGAGVPDYVDAKELKRLEELNLVGKVKDADVVPATVPQAVDL